MQCDFIVIGAGIAGASVCARLAPHASVVLLEMESTPGYHSTGRSAATWIENYGNSTIVKLNRASFGFLSEPPTGFVEGPVLRQRGVLWTALPGQSAAMEAALNDDVASMDSAAALARVPALDVDYIEQFAYEDAAFDIDVALLHQGYLRQMRAADGSLHCNSAVSSLVRKNGRWHVQAGDAEYTAPVVVNAAGAWADEVAALAGVKRVGLVPKRRSAALIDVPDQYDVSDWPLVSDVDELVYFRPDSGRLMLSPADATAVEPHDAWADDMAIARAAHTFGEMMQFEVTRLSHTWGGLRTFVPDKTPVVGMDDVDGFFWLAGQGGYGIQTSPAMAMLASSLLLGNALDAALVEQSLEPGELAPQRASLNQY